VTIPRDILDETPALSQWAILGGYRGSIAHGTYTPDNIDDKDVMYFCVPPIRYYTGLKQFGSHGTLEIKRAEWDIVIYEARKAISLLAQGNPNVLCMLWLSDKHRLCMTEAGSLLFSRRDLFVGKHVYHSFVGYAKGQLHRMTHYQGRPPTELAYMAGIFDGEGHVSISLTRGRKESWSPLYLLDVGITNTDHDLIQHLLDEYGGYAGRTGIRDGHRLDAYRWRVSGPMGAKFLKTIYPHLRIKRRQAEIGMAFQESIARRKTHGPLSQEDLDGREEFRVSLRQSRKDKETPVPGDAKGESELGIYAAAYMGEKRKALVAQFGYDTKNAAHLVRLLRMGIEFLTDGVLRIEREDASELLDIKRGRWTLEKVKEESDRLFALAQEAFVHSPLPAEPDREAIDLLCQQVVSRAWQERQEETR
jgi:hypothetical protein